MEPNCCTPRHSCCKSMREGHAGSGIWFAPHAARRASRRLQSCPCSFRAACRAQRLAMPPTLPLLMSRCAPRAAPRTASDPAPADFAPRAARRASHCLRPCPCCFAPRAALRSGRRHQISGLGASRARGGCNQTEQGGEWGALCGGGTQRQARGARRAARNQEGARRGKGA